MNMTRREQIEFHASNAAYAIAAKAANDAYAAAYCPAYKAALVDMEFQFKLAEDIAALKELAP